MNQRSEYDSIEGEAWERYLFDLLSGWTAELKRLDRNPYRVVTEIRLVGDRYPRWGFEVDFTNTQNGRKATSRFPIGDWRSREVAMEAITEIMTAVEGGG
jgi:hypothetical protein